MFCACIATSSLYVYPHVDQVKCERCCFCECQDDPNLFMTFMWLHPEGELLYKAFLHEQLSDGGVFHTAMAEGAITSSRVQELQEERSAAAYIGRAHV